MSLKGGHRIRSFVSHFIHIEIFQMEISSLSLISTRNSSKYELMIFLDRKQRFTFANLLHLFIQGPSLTHSVIVVKV